MIVEIQKAIIDTLKANSFGVEAYDFKDLVSGQINQYKIPAVRLTSRTGTPKKSMQGYVLTSTISIILITKTLESKKASEFETMKLITDLYNILTHNKLGLLKGEHNQEPVIQNGLLPGSYNDITQVGGTTDFQAAGYAVYEIQFMATFDIIELPQPQDVERGQLKVIQTQIHGNNDSIPEVESTTDFTVINGGNAYTTFFDETINGGNAGTPDYDYDETIDGGNAETDFDC